MTGVYIHIPYCMRKCAYCDFCSVPRDLTVEQYPDALCREIELSRDRLPYEGPVPSVFFGGGTPTVLPADDLVRILDTIRKTYEVRTDGEIAARAELYRGQLLAYARALTRIFEKPVKEGVLFFLTPGQEVRVI